VRDVPFHYFLLHLAGYNQAYFEMVDHAEEFERLITVMEQVERERLWPVVADSPARLILHGVHFDSQMTPRTCSASNDPVLPGLQRPAALAGKSLTWHATTTAKTSCEVKAAGSTCPSASARPHGRGDPGGGPRRLGTMSPFRRVTLHHLEPGYPDAEFEAYMRISSA